MDLWGVATDLLRFPQPGQGFCRFRSRWVWQPKRKPSEGLPNRRFWFPGVHLPGLAPFWNSGFLDCHSQIDPSCTGCVPGTPAQGIRWFADSSHVSDLHASGRKPYGSHHPLWKPSHGEQNGQRVHTSRCCMLRNKRKTHLLMVCLWHNSEWFDPIRSYIHSKEEAPFRHVFLGRHLTGNHQETYRGWTKSCTT